MAPYVPAGTYTCSYYTVTSDTTGSWLTISTAVCVTEFRLSDTDALKVKEQEIIPHRPTGAFININRKVKTSRRLFETYEHFLMIKAIQYRPALNHIGYNLPPDIFFWRYFFSVQHG